MVDGVADRYLQTVVSLDPLWPIPLGCVAGKPKEKTTMSDERRCECQNENRGLFIWRGDPDWLSCTQCDDRVRPLTEAEKLERADPPEPRKREATVKLNPDFQFGNPKVNAVTGNCCGKPVGCTMTHEGCVYLSHPWKRANVVALQDTEPRKRERP